MDTSIVGGWAGSLRRHLISGKGHGLSWEAEGVGMGNRGGGPGRVAWLGPWGWVWALGVVGTGVRVLCGHSISKVGGGHLLGPGPGAHAFLEGHRGQCPHTHLGPLGIDKLTEKSQVSEDGTLRSLEPVPQQGSADGSPIVEVGLGDPVGGFPFLPGLPRVGQARVP